MIQIGDKVTIQWFPWSPHPITIEKEVIDTEEFDKIGPVEKMVHMTPDGSLAQIMNKKIKYRIYGGTEYLKGVKFNYKIEKMSEVKEPMKTKELQKLIDQGKSLVFKIPDYRGGTHTWCLQKDHEKTLVNGKYWTDIRAMKMNTVYLGEPYGKWNDHQKIINNDMRALHRMDWPTPIPFNDSLGEYLIDIIGAENKSKVEKHHKVSKKEFLKIRKGNFRKIKEAQKRVRHAHQTNVMSIGKCKPQNSVNLKTTINYTVQITFAGSDLIRRKKYHNFKNPIYRKVTSNSPIAVYNVIRNQFKSADLLIREWSSKEGTQWRRSSMRSAKKGFKSNVKDNPNLHLRMVCIKHAYTGEVQRMSWHKAERWVNNPDWHWTYCQKWEYKRWVGMESTRIKRSNPNDGWHKRPMGGPPKVRKTKGIAGNPKYRTTAKFNKANKTTQERREEVKRRYETKLRRRRERNQRNADRLEHKLYKKSPHLTSKDKIKLKRMLKNDFRKERNLQKTKGTS